MKILLFLISASLLSILPSTCQHSKNNTSDDMVKVDSSAIEAPPTVLDSMGTIVEDGQSNYGSTEVDRASKDDKYKSGSQEKHEAPKHNSPNQAKVDSIKESKKKTKGKKD